MTTFSLNEYFANVGTDVLCTFTYRKSDRNEEHHTGVDPGFLFGVQLEKVSKNWIRSEIAIFKVFLMF